MYKTQAFAYQFSSSFTLYIPALKGHTLKHIQAYRTMHLKIPGFFKNLIGSDINLLYLGGVYKPMCTWPGKDKLMQKYHDCEWGVPVTNDSVHFEFLVLESFQAGLSWKTILHRRKGFKKAFANFNYKKIAAFTLKDIERLMKDEGIIRNELKIKAAINNARLFMDIQKEFGSFNKYLWSFVNNKPQVNKFKFHGDIPATSAASDAMAADMKKRGFKFRGSTICYANMQAVGLVNDHLISCPRYKEIIATYKELKI